MALQGPTELVGDLAGVAGQPERVALWDVQGGGLRTAEARSVLENGVEDVSGVRTCAAERRQDLAARR